MRYKIGIGSVLVGLLTLSAGKPVRADDPSPAWVEVARFALNPTFIGGAGSDEAIGPDGRWHIAYTTWVYTPAGCPLPSYTYSSIVYQNEAGERVTLATAIFEWWCDSGNTGSEIWDPSVSVNPRGDVLIAYTVMTLPGSTERVLLRRANQLQRWENAMGVSGGGSGEGELAGHFAPAYSIDVERGRIDPAKPTVVLVHGWNSSSQTSLNVGEELSIWRRLADAMFGKGVNVLAWDWLYEARSMGDGLHNVPGDPAHLRGQASLLLEQLRRLLGAGGRPLHLIGHSLGASIVAHAAAASAGADGLERVTLFDTVEHPLASLLDAPRQDLDIEALPSIPHEIAIDNYFSWSGCGYDNMGANGVNVNLRNGSGFWWPDPRLHAYPRDWYLGTVAELDKARMYTRDGGEILGEHAGWWWSPTIGDNGSSANDWVQGREYELREPLEPSRCDRVVGTGNQGFLEGTWDQSGIVEQQGDVITLREGSSATISQSVNLDSQAVGIRFEYLFENGGDGDSLGVYWGDRLVWRRVGAEFKGSTFAASGLVDLSAERGTTGVLSFALETTGQPNAVLKLRGLELFRSSCAGCFDLAVIVRGVGGVQPAGGAYPSGTSVDVTATPAADWRFNRWDTDEQGGWEITHTINVVMDSHRSVMAVFAPAHAGDPDEDGDADLGDVAIMQTCFGLAAGGACTALDFTGDNTVSLDDLTMFTEALSGPYP